MVEDGLSLFSLEGRVALVTGASRGIGAALADGLARAGSQVTGVARSSAPQQASSSITYISADVTKDMSEVVERVLAGFGRLDIMVNAAGISRPAASEPQSLEAFDETLSVNLRAAYAVCRAAARHMTPGGSIINVASIGGLTGFPNNPAYVASKGGLRLLTKALAVDYGPRGVRVNALVPGYIHTDMTAISFADPTRHAQRAAHTCLGRWGEVGDLVGAAVFLASDASRYMTGQDLVIDGGWTAKGLI